MKNHPPKKFAILLGFIIITASCGAQEEIILDYQKLINGMNELSSSALFIKTPQGTGTATAFSIPFSDTLQSKGRVFLATAKHVLDIKDKDGRTVGRFDTVTVVLQRKNASKEERKYRAVYFSREYDVAVLGPIERIRSFEEYDVTAVSIDMIASFAEIIKGQMAFIAGYPFGIGAKGSFVLNPVLQSGIIAYVDTLNSLILIDIPVNFGNSGCPAYIVTKEGKPKLAGLVFAYEPSTQDQVLRSSTFVPANSSLGRVVPLKAIIADFRNLLH